MASSLVRRFKLSLATAALALFGTSFAAAAAERMYVYIVRPGDTASFLLHRSGLVPIYRKGGYLRKLKKLNPSIHDMDLIYPGQRIYFSDEFVGPALGGGVIAVTPENEIRFLSSEESEGAPSEHLLEGEDAQEEAAERAEAPAPVPPPADSAGSKSRKTLSLGVGATYLAFAQNGSGIRNLEYASVGSPSFSLQGEIEWAGGYGIVGAAGFYPGELRSRNSTLLNKEFLWETKSFELTARLGRRYADPGRLRARLGIQHHRLPYLQFPLLATAVIRSSGVYNATIGLDYQRKLSEDWLAEGLIRYQALLQQSAPGGQFKLEDRFAFDGSIGLKRRFANRLAIGAYWYGQWLEFDYSGENAAIGLVDVGASRFFFSNIELRLCYDF